MSTALNRFSTGCVTAAKLTSIFEQVIVQSQIRKISTITASLTALLAIGQFHTADAPIRIAVQSNQSQRFSTGSQRNQESDKESVSIMSERLQKAKEGAIWGMMIADAMAMPVHWFYNPADIKKRYGGWLKGYTAPCKHHPSSILSLSAVGAISLFDPIFLNTVCCRDVKTRLYEVTGLIGALDGAGRTGGSSASKPVIGGVILKDKLKFWQSSDRSVHYHQGMQAGENTLNLVVAGQMLKTMQRVDHDHQMANTELMGAVLEDYVKLLTTPGSHNDTYAESFHRVFFKDWASIEDPPKTAEQLLKFTKERYSSRRQASGDGQLIVIGALAPALPWILHNAHRSEDECADRTIEFIKCTHPVPALIPFIDLYSRLMHGVLNGRDLKQEVVRVLSHSELGGPQKREMVLALLDKAASASKGSEERLKIYQLATQTLGSACYIEGALSSLLFLAYQFADDFEAGVLANANCGGENCHRGAALGALLGAHAVNSGKTIPAHLIDGLVAKQDLKSLL